MADTREPRGQFMSLQRAVMPSGLEALPAGSRAVGDDAPYADVHPSRALVDRALLVQSPLHGEVQPPYDGEELMGESFVGRLQPPLGFSGGAYALNTEHDTGSPQDLPDEALPGLRDGTYRFSQRLRSQGDQGIMDNLLRQGGSYLEVNQSPYIGG